MAYDVEKTRSWWRDRVQALLLTVTTGVLSLLGLLLIIAGPHFGHLLTELFAVPRALGDIWPALRLITIFVIFVAAASSSTTLRPIESSALCIRCPEP